jgi:Zn ribbon nucleic-acid-binding protein
VTSINEFIKAGLVCPSCKSKNFNAAYHEWQNMDSFICRKCGLRWQEDTTDFVRFINNTLKNHTQKENSKRFIWVLHLANHTSKPLKNPLSADETSYAQFIGVPK